MKTCFEVFTIKINSLVNIKSRLFDTIIINTKGVFMRSGLIKAFNTTILKKNSAEPIFYLIDKF